MLKISVVLTTYQGEKYIIEQLSSIMNQTRQPDEVIIRDDNSSDTTLEIVTKFISDYNLNNWFFIRNTKNEGWKKNFKDALELTSGDIIFLCDQDDIWIETKIEEMVCLFDKIEEMELLVSDYTIFRESLPKSSIRFGSVKKVKFSRKFIHNQYPGCVYCFRKSLLDIVLKFWSLELPHDQQIWLIANVRESLYIYDKPLVLYRRHDETATGRDILSRKTKLRNINYEYLGVDTVLEYVNHYPVSDSRKNIIISTKSYIMNRINFFNKRNLKKLLCTFKYIAYYFSIKTFFGDIYVNFFKK